MNKKFGLLVLPVFALLSSCTIEKRLYRDGFYIERKIQRRQSEYISPKINEHEINQRHFSGETKEQVDSGSLIFSTIAPPAEKVKHKINENNPPSIIFKKPAKAQLIRPEPFYRQKDAYRSRPFLVVSAGLLSLALITLSVWLFLLGGFVLVAVIALLLSDSMAFLAFLSINSDDIDALPKWKRIILKTGQVMLFMTMIILFPVSLLWFLIYVNFMIGGDMS